jgi:SnoaL-like protein
VIGVSLPPYLPVCTERFGVFLSFRKLNSILGATRAAASGFDCPGGTEISLELPKPIVAFFAGENARNTEPVAQYFTDGAVLRDEARTIEGLTAIKEWKAKTKKKYQHTIEPLASVHKDGKTVVTARVAGNFPGSPVDLQFVFSVEAGKIPSLEIR